MKQKPIIVLAVSILTCALFAGCGNDNSAQTKETIQNESNSNSPDESANEQNNNLPNDKQNDVQNKNQNDKLQETNTPAKNTDTDDIEDDAPEGGQDEKEAFVFRPIVDSPFYESAYSKNHMQTYRNMMNALMEYKSEFTIEEGVQWWEVGEFVSYLFPAFEYVVEQVDQNGFTGNIVYKNNKETTETILKNFAEKVELWINSCTKPEDPDVLKALEIYHKLSLEFSYDYETNGFVEQGVFFDTDVSPYRAIMESTGICQSFAPAYSYLLMQVGIDACPTGGLLKDNSAAHVWTALKLYDKWFYADVTYENTDGSRGKRLFYFGETTENRSNIDNYSVETMNIGECNRIWGNDMDFSDERFFCLDEIYEVKEMTYDSDNVIVKGLDFSYEPITVKIPLE